MSGDEHRDLWDQLASGELSAEEHGLLRALAEEDRDTAARLEGFAPLGADFEQAITNQVTEQLSSNRRARSWYVAGVAFAAAAAVVVAYLTLDPSAAPSPMYALTVHGGVQQLRGQEPDADEVPYFLPATRVELRLTPTERTHREQVVALVLSRRGEQPRVLPCDVDRDESGAMRIVGPAARVFAGVPEGRWTVSIWLGDSVPEEQDLAEWVDRRDPSLLQTEIELRSPDGDDT